MVRTERRLPTRRDAVANREKLLAGAEIYFAEYGIDAPLHGLAEQVGVGIGTLYRNFPGQADLISALHDRAVDRIEAIARSATREKRGWAALTTLIEETVAMTATHPATPAVLRRQSFNDPSHRALSGWERTVGRLVQRAKSDGDLRADAQLADVIALPFTVAALPTTPIEKRQEVSARLTRIFLDGIHTHPHEASNLGEANDDMELAQN